MDFIGFPWIPERQSEVPPKQWTGGGELEKEEVPMSTERKKERKRYDLEFKKQAVQLVLSSGRPLAEIARELGVSDWNLRDWRLRLQAQLGAQPDSVEALRLRVAQLERDNLQLREQRDILKKTLGIVSTP